MPRLSSRSRRRDLIRLVLLIAVVGAAVWYQNRYGDTPSLPPASESPVLDDEAPEGAVRLDPDPALPPKKELQPPLGIGADPVEPDGRGLEKLTACRLVDHRNNDGDSFRVSHGDREFELRLYYVDAPEKYLSDRYDSQRRRVDDQARDFGGISTEQTVALGHEARDFVAELLKGKTFTVYTKWEQVFDSDRYYAFVLVPGDKQGQYLSEALVENGLARIHTKGVPTPDGRSYLQFKRRLETLEAEAKAARRGAWAF